jgi:hypothetical protein
MVTRIGVVHEVVFSFVKSNGLDGVLDGRMPAPCAITVSPLLLVGSSHHPSQPRDAAAPELVVLIEPT